MAGESKMGPRRWAQSFLLDLASPLSHQLLLTREADSTCWETLAQKPVDGGRVRGGSQPLKGCQALGSGILPPKPTLSWFLLPA